MRNVIFDRRRAERFAQLLDEADGGPRHHGRSRADDQLAELVAVGHKLGNVPPGAQIDPDFRTGLRAMLMATAEREGIGATAGAPEADDEAANGPVARLIRAGTAADGAGRRFRARGAIVIGVVAGAVAVSGMSAASSDAQPGDMLYGVKRQSERAHLALARSDEEKGQLFLDFARTRLGEARAVTGDIGGFAAVLGDMDADTREGVRLLTGSAVRSREEAPLETVDSFVTGQRKQIGAVLETLSGTNRDRALDSLILLDSVDKRAAALAESLACPPDTTPQADVLGPLPHTCRAPGQAAKTDGAGSETAQGGGQRAQVDQQSGAPSATRDPSVTADTPAESTAPTATPAETTADSEPVVEDPAPSPSPTPTATDGGNLLDDLLGGLLGD